MIGHHKGHTTLITYINSLPQGEVATVAQCGEHCLRHDLNVGVNYQNVRNWLRRLSENGEIATCSTSWYMSLREALRIEKENSKAEIERACATAAASVKAIQAKYDALLTAVADKIAADNTLSDIVRERIG